MAVALVTGASRGLGEALAGALVERGWSVVIDARGEPALEAVARRITPKADASRVTAVVGDVTDPDHRARLIEAAWDLGGLDLLVNNASALGPSPLPHLEDHPLDALREVYEVDVVAPVALAQLALPMLRHSAQPRIVNITSDASVEAYEGWGGYGSAKAALDHVSAVLAEEEPDVRVWAVDPGDMRTAMHQEAFPGEDISDRPLPATVVPALLDLIESDRPSGRYRAADLQPVEASARVPAQGA
jgi:NAD(P)-dependent dehydrogenase (short-subunit alcohol dehydrogenase family)